VEFSSDIFIIKPKDPARGNGVVFFDVVNRGNKLGTFTRGGRNADPRRSVAERYTSRAEYLKQVEQSGRRLAEARYILGRDVEPIMQEAGQHWDALRQTSTSR
jgi:hypothetical protein